jgi:hypothetical protein
MSSPIRSEDRTDNAFLYAPRWARQSPPLQPDSSRPAAEVSKPTRSPPMAPDAAGFTSSLPMAPGIGGFNIDPPLREATAFEGDLAVKELRRQLALHPDLALTPPIRLQRNPEVPWLWRLSLVLLAAVVAFGVVLVMFPGDFPGTRRHDKGIAAAVAPLLEELTKATPAPTPARLVVESQRAFANEPLPLGVALNDASGGEVLTLVGLTAGTKLSAGAPRGLTGWQVSARDLSKAFAYAPMDFVGVMDAAVDLRSATDRLMDSQVVRLEWIQKKPEVAAVLGPRRDPFAPPPPIVPLDPEEIATLLKRGHDFLKAGDVAAARLALRRAAAAGNERAALALGATFDPAFLVELGVLGFASDVTQARVWYQRALELGSNEASRRLQLLAGVER